MNATFHPRRSTLPRYLTPFIGRAQEVISVRQLIGDRPLVTLTGPGGSGKTRLAREVAAGLEDAFAGGVWWVELAELAEPALVPQAVAAALGVQEELDQRVLNAVAGFLAERHALLVLDNCEHLLDGCAQIAAALLQDCPRLHVLATSRQALGLPGEIVRPMLPLSLPALHDRLDLAEFGQIEAIALFVDRAAALAPGFSLSEANAQAISRICRSLDGMPLAIELAAARTPVLSVAQIAKRLAESTRLLAAGSRLAQPRHQTMHAAIGWSYELLLEPEQTLWRRLAVFRGGFSLTAAETVCSDAAHDGPGNLRSDAVLDLLAQLVHKSLVAVSHERDEARYRLLEPLRQFAAGQLEAAGETAALRQRHCDYYLAWAQAHTFHLQGPDQLQSLAEFDERYANLRAALSWCLRPEAAAGDGLRLVVALGVYWIMRNLFSEGRRWLVKILALPGAQAPTLEHGQALWFASVLTWYQNDISTARRYIEESHAIMTSLGHAGPWGTAHTEMMLGMVLRFQRQEPAALGHLRESVDRMRRNGDLWGLALALDCLGATATQVGDLSAARAALEESQTVWQALGDPWGIALNRLQYFMLADRARDAKAAQAIYAENRAAYEAAGNIWHLMVMHLCLGDMALQRGDFTAAAEHYERCLDLTRQQGNDVYEGYSLIGLGAVALGQNRLAEAIALCRNGLALHQRRQRARSASLGLLKVAGVATQAGHAATAAQLRAAASALMQVADANPHDPSDEAAAFAQAHVAVQRLAAQPAASGPAAPAGRPFDLTPRELEVLRLVVEGLSNAQIAERLVLSPRTVHAHLRSILDKLDVSSRTAAARLAIEQGLV